MIPALEQYKVPEFNELEPKTTIKEFEIEYPQLSDLPSLRDHLADIETKGETLIRELTEESKAAEVKLKLCELHFKTLASENFGMKVEKKK